MPLYEYECAGCGKRFELIQKFSDPPEALCVACGARAHRLLSPPALQFKGSGWYITDYARKAPTGEKSGKEEKTEKADSQPGSREPAPAPAGKDKEKKFSGTREKTSGSSA